MFHCATIASGYHHVLVCDFDFYILVSSAGNHFSLICTPFTHGREHFISVSHSLFTRLLFSLACAVNNCLLTASFVGSLSQGSTSVEHSLPCLHVASGFSCSWSLVRWYHCLIICFHPLLRSSLRCWPVIDAMTHTAYHIQATFLLCFQDLLCQSLFETFNYVSMAFFSSPYHCDGTFHIIVF